MNWIACLIIFVLYITTISADNNDSLFKYAQQSARNGEYSTAISHCNTLLHENPENVDALLLKGSVYSWMHICDSAAFYLNRSRVHAEKYKDIHLALVNLWKWCNNEDSLRITLSRAQSFFPDDTNFSFRRIQDNNSKMKPAVRQVTSLIFHADFFRKSNQQHPWESATLYHKIKLQRLTFVPIIQSARRWYGNSLYRGAEGKIEAVIDIIKPLSVTTSLSASSYKHFDTLFPEYSISSGCIIHPQRNIESSIEFYFKDYGNSEYITISAGSGLYSRQITVNGKFWLSPWEKRVYVSGSAEIAVNSIKNEYRFIAAKVGLGKGPPDAGSPEYAEYTFVMGRLHGSLPAGIRVSFTPFLEFRKEQYGFAPPYLHYNCGTGVSYFW